MNPKEIQPEDVTPTFTIECAACGNDETLQAANSEAAAERFNSLGWKEYDGDILCPECAEVKQWLTQS